MRSFHRPPLTPQSTRQLQHLLLVATFRISNLLTAVRNSLPLVSLLSHNPALGSSPNCEEVEPRGMWPVLLAPSDFNPPPLQQSGTNTASLWEYWYKSHWPHTKIWSDFIAVAETNCWQLLNPVWSGESDRVKWWMTSWQRRHEDD